MKHILSIAASAFLLSSCSIYSSYKSPEIAPLAVDQSFGSGSQDTLLTAPEWNQVFTDPNLQVLLTKALTSNVDLQVAALSVEQSEALLRTAKLAYLPSFMLAPEGGVMSLDKSKAAYSYNLPVNAQWEIDLFGKLRNSKEQTRSALMQTLEYKKLLQTQVIAALANNYYTLVMLDKQLQITQECVANQKQNLDVIIAMKEAGMQTEAAVNQASANLLNVQASEKDIQKQIRLIENAISLLINEAPERIERTGFGQSGLNTIALSDEIAFVTLANRPDVRQAEYALRESFYGVNTARSAFYPSITLGGTAGWTNSAGGMISNPGQLLLSAIGSLTQPLFNKGINQANLKISKARYEQTKLQFHQALLNAGVEVNDALILCQNSRDKLEIRSRQVEANQKALDNSLELMKHSSNTYLDVLYAEITLLQSRLVQVSDWFEGVQGKITLYKALGGGSSQN
ncbi:MAG: TolC family protein [Bacteroidales bacterium]